MVTPPHNDGSSNKAMWMALNLAWELGYIIAIPALVLGIGGAYADKYFGTSPYLTLGGFLLAAVLSFISVWRRIRAILKS